MDLFEYQAKELFTKHDVPVTAQRVVTSGDAATRAATELGGTVVVKAQVKVGGRGKAGGVKLASSPEEAGRCAEEILALTIKGHPVHTVVVTEACDIAEEYYVAFLLDRAARTHRALVSREGGVDIEEVAATQPEALVSVPVSALDGFGADDARALWSRAGLPEDAADQAAELLPRLWDVFTAEDATLVEVNPLVRTGDGRLVALDGKVTLDDNASYRHEDHAAFADVAGDDRFEATARAKGLNYVRLDGQVGIIGNGAGLVMSTLDVVAYAGERHGVRPANFLDIGGGASAQVMADALSVLMADPGVTSVLINVFGGITQCDAVAEGIVRATRLLDSEDGSSVDRPLVVRLDGNNAEAGRRILDEAGIAAVRSADTMDGAAAMAAELAGREG